MKLEHYKTKFWKRGEKERQLPFTAEEGLARVRSICGQRCHQWDCDCVSVVNAAHSQLCWEHNTGEPADID